MAGSEIPNNEAAFRFVKEYPITFTGGEKVATDIRAGNYDFYRASSVKKFLHKLPKPVIGPARLKIINFKGWILPQWIPEIFKSQGFVSANFRHLLALGAWYPNILQDTGLRSIIALGTSAFTTENCSPAFFDELHGKKCKALVEVSIDESWITDKAGFLALPG